MVLAGPIVRLLFQHGRFTADNAALTVAALGAYTLGLPAYSAVKILVSAFYSMKDTKTPVKIATCSSSSTSPGTFAHEALGRRGTGFFHRFRLDGERFDLAPRLARAHRPARRRGPS